ncbi:hypothetical protein [Brachyspira murdochii]|uniref:HEPN domain-containing protein n=1 Tax=Brachyspira murdochii (strain ATCC 51284 / DSM 12563 / 56-150) TaxID=526224 RepID=D5U9V1_BRAM5|nr:hypothetical protein [Brachyspira murdochii]ADG71474.1 hypothetical protein Bmur_1384 [Brachyspira murdochii DSM 12563]
MKKRGEVNIAIADYLYDNFNFVSNHITINIENSDLRHIIISRWYYGLYLIAKDYLVNIKGIVDLSKYFKHKSNKEHDIKSIWSRLADFFEEYHSDILQGEELARLREYYEYSGNLCSDIDFNNARRIFNEIYEILNTF